MAAEETRRPPARELALAVVGGQWKLTHACSQWAVPRRSEGASTTTAAKQN
jgi:hypothetical protein